MSVTLIIIVCFYAGFYFDARNNLFGIISTSNNVQIIQQEVTLNARHINPRETIYNLPKDVIDGVKTFVFFLGHAHSGHSIVGSLLDAHPHMVIAHEANVFGGLCQGTLKPKRDAIFNTIWKNTVRGSEHGTRVSPVKGYSLLVKGLYEGKYVDHIEVIGDKKAGTTTSILLKQQTKFFHTLDSLKSLTDSVKMIHVIRNPYDNIATSMVYVMNSKKEVASIKKSENIVKVKNVTVFNQIRRYFTYYKVIEEAKHNLEYIEVHGRDLVRDARGTISRMCDGLGVFCSDSYLDVCSDKVFKNESKTRYKIQWNKEQLDEIQRNIDRFSSLNGYTFDS